MQLWQDGLVAALAAVGVVSLLWCLGAGTMALFRPRGVNWAVVVPASGDAGTLPQQICTLEVLDKERGLAGPILVVDCGLSGEGRSLCRILEREVPRLRLCRPEELPALFPTNDDN